MSRTRRFNVEKNEHAAKSEEVQDLDQLFAAAENETDPARVARLEKKVNFLWLSMPVDQQMSYLEIRGMTEILNLVKKFGGKVVKWDLKPKPVNSPEWKKS